MIFVIINFKNFGKFLYFLLTRVICIARMDVGMVLLTCYYLQYGKYIIVCLFVMFFVYMLFYFYTFVPHWYVSFYDVVLAECVSLLIMGVLCFFLAFTRISLLEACVLLSGVKFV
jgi:hypothetical protein